MLRGFISGVFWGLVLCIGGFWATSQFVDMVRLLSPPEVVVETVEAPAPAPQEAPDAPASLPAGQDDAPVPAAPAAEALDAPEPEPQPQAPAAPEAPAPALPSADAATPQTPQVTGGDAPAAPAPEAPAARAEAPAPEGAQPPAEETPPQEAEAPGPAPQVGDVPQDMAEAGPTPDAPVTATPRGEDSAPTPAPEAAQPSLPRQESTPSVDFSTPQEVVLPPKAQMVAPEPEPQPDPAPEESPAATSVQPAQAPIVVAGGEGGLMRRVGSLVDPAGPETEAAPAETPAEAAAAEEIDENAPALVRFARPYEAPPGLPRVAIVLIAEPDGHLATSESTLPVPVTFGIDAAREDAAQLMRRARDQGQEVVAITPLPSGARPQDVETALPVYLERVPEAVAVMDVPSGEFQANRQVAAQVVEAALAEGRGVITYPRGLNSAMQVAERDKAPAELVFRVIDEGQRDRAAIKRFLDQGAFRAGQMNGVLLVGRDNPETVAAILEWLLGSRASSVTLVPVSALLTD